MKSEKANDILNAGSCHVDDGILSDGHRVRCPELTYYDYAIEAVKVAEQEAEERMREKAVEAFKSECVYRDQRCKPDCEGCGIVKQFIQKLNEE